MIVLVVVQVLWTRTVAVKNDLEENIWINLETVETKKGIIAFAIWCGAPMNQGHILIKGFDKRMKIYAKHTRNKERNRQEWKQTQKVAALSNGIRLTTVDDILKNHVQIAKLQLNAELMNHVDEYLNNHSDINTE